MQKAKKLKINNEYSWQVEARDYFKHGKHARNWFEYMEWLLILGGLDYLSAKTNNQVLDILDYISWFFLYSYIQHNLWTIKYQVLLPNFIKGRAKQLITYIIAVVIVSVSYILVKNVVQELTKLNP